MPTLLLYGDADRRSPLGTVAAELHEKIPGSRLRILPGVGHAANMEAPDWFNAEVREFLNAVSYEADGRRDADAAAQPAGRGGELGSPARGPVPRRRVGGGGAGRRRRPAPVRRAVRGRGRRRDARGNAPARAAGAGQPQRGRAAAGGGRDQAGGRGRPAAGYLFCDAGLPRAGASRLDLLAAEDPGMAAAYDHWAEAAAAAGWPVARLDAGHFHPLADPGGVAAALLELLARM